MKQLRSLAKANTATGVISLKMQRPPASIASKAQREGISLRPVNRSPENGASPVFDGWGLSVVLAQLTNAEADLAGRVDHETSLTGWCRYASIAQFERTSLRRSPHFNMPMISSRRKFADQLGSLSSPDFSRTLQAIAKDCSISSVSVIAEKTAPRPICSYTADRPGEPDAWRPAG